MTITEVLWSIARALLHVFHDEFFPKEAEEKKAGAAPEAKEDGAPRSRPWWDQAARGTPPKAAPHSWWAPPAPPKTPPTVTIETDAGTIVAAVTFSGEHMLGIRRVERPRAEGESRRRRRRVVPVLVSVESLIGRESCDRGELASCLDEAPILALQLREPEVPAAACEGDAPATACAGDEPLKAIEVVATAAKADDTATAAEADDTASSSGADDATAAGGSALAGEGTSPPPQSEAAVAPAAVGCEAGPSATTSGTGGSRDGSPNLSARNTAGAARSPARLQPSSPSPRADARTAASSAPTAGAPPVTSPPKKTTGPLRIVTTLATRLSLEPSPPSASTRRRRSA